jgi:hypothetical protein
MLVSTSRAFSAATVLAVLGSSGIACNRHHADARAASADSSASAAPPAGPLPSSPPTAQAPKEWKTGVTLRLERVFDGGELLSFGLPLPRSVVVDPAAVRVKAASAPVASGVRIKPILFDYDRNGKRAPRALLVQIPASLMTASTLDVEVLWAGTTGSAPALSTESYAKTRRESPEVVQVAERAIVPKHGGIAYDLVVKKAFAKTLYVGFEPTVIPKFPPGYLSGTAIFGDIMSREEMVNSPRLKGLTFLSDNLRVFANGARYDEGYPMKPEAVLDPVTAYEGWLYDRCATFLIAHVHLGERENLRHALRGCSYYSSKIRRTGDDAGTFSGKPNPDLKYSHLRGLYAYYAMTGDEDALGAGKAIADVWLEDKFFAKPYRNGSARGSDKLWTERLLAVDLEAMIYGYYLLGDPRYLAAFRELFETAYKHLTTKDGKELAAITKVSFAPQSCFIHSAEQHGEGDADEPWCSGWMAEMLVDPLLRYQELTGDPRVDDVFVHLTRALRDNGTNYFNTNPKGDSFLAPQLCWTPEDTEHPRVLVPLYGFGIDAAGKRRTFAEYADSEHCADATALTAVAIRALKRQNKFDAPGVGPFKTEGESFVALHEELSYCAKRSFAEWTRTSRDPKSPTSKMLAEGYNDGNEKAQADWLEKQRIGHPVHITAPTRKLSWWFNGSLSQFRMLEEADVSFPRLRPGFIQGPGCAPRGPAILPP